MTTGKPRPIQLPIRQLFSVLLSTALVLAFLVTGEPAWGATEEIEAKISEAQQRIEDSAAAYDAALARVGELQAQAAENEERIAELESELPRQRERSDEALTALYKMNREGYSLIDMVLSADSITDFLGRLDYLSRLQSKNCEAVYALTAMEAELVETQEALDAALDEAEEQQRQAELSLAEAKEAREEAQREAQEQARKEREAQEAARKAAEQEQAAREAASREEAADDEEAASTESETTNEVPDSSPSDDGANWDSDKEAFVESWAGRIDSYLSGSPLAGKGAVFASAAWDYGVDPRWSPAISELESSKGAVCFKPHNAWGWGSASWGSWDEAIEAHVAGLARGYGYTLTEEAAKKYCPPTWQHWYSRCSEEMNSI